MKKTIYLCAILVGFLNACVPNVVVDTKGRSGTFDFSRAEDLTNDKILCEQLVKDNVNLAFDYSRYAFAKYVEIGTIGLIKDLDSLMIIKVIILVESFQFNY